MPTMQAVVDRARVPLNDDDGVRATDPQLLAYLIAGIEVLRNKRPDLFFGQFAALPGEALVIGSTFPLPDELIPALADYATARAQLRGDEEAVAAQAPVFFALFTSEVPG